jgi:hypothetical protein
MKIALISLDNWGLNQNIANCLIKKGHDVLVIDFNKFKYKYPSFCHRVLNFLMKLLFKKNLKFQYYGQEIISVLKDKNEIQDLILVIKADFIDQESLQLLRQYTKKSIAFFNDSIARYPDTKRVLNCFDEVYSFEKIDCEKYNLKFKTNYIIDAEKEPIANKTFEIQLFNISSRDQRTADIIKIAKNLHDNSIDYKIIIFDEKYRIKENPFVEVIRKPIPLNEITKMIEKSKAVLDIQRNNQLGLTFRVFESLGAQKKLITTNNDIKNYDFYNPNNILVIDAENPIIPKSFFETDYENVPEPILSKYKLENWVTEFTT